MKSKKKFVSGKYNIIIEFHSRLYDKVSVPTSFEYDEYELVNDSKCLPPGNYIKDGFDDGINRNGYKLKVNKLQTIIQALQNPNDEMSYSIWV